MTGWPRLPPTSSVPRAVPGSPGSSPSRTLPSSQCRTRCLKLPLPVLPTATTQARAPAGSQAGSRSLRWPQARHRTASRRKWPPPLKSESVQEAVVAHCERLRYRFGILDIPDGRQRIEDVLGWREKLHQRLRRPVSPVARHARPAEPGSAPLRFVPPSGHVAGIYALTDLQVGVHKPPANEPVAAANDVRFRLSDAAHGELNTGGVNVIRAYPGRGPADCRGENAVGGPPVAVRQRTPAGLDDRGHTRQGHTMDGLRAEQPELRREWSRGPARSC